LASDTKTASLPPSGKNILASWKIAGASSLAVTEKGEVYGWGWNSKRCVGLGHTSLVLAPTLVIPQGALEVAAGCGHNFVLMEDRTLMAWGYNQRNQLGMDGKVLTPKKLYFDFPGSIRGLGCGSDFTFVVLEDGLLYLWGGEAWEREKLKPTLMPNLRVSVPFSWQEMGRCIPFFIFEVPGQRFGTFRFTRGSTL
jgi:alpha-tubulin suppressor-like RCC1 family protein